MESTASTHSPVHIWLGETLQMQQQFAAIKNEFHFSLRDPCPGRLGQALAHKNNGRNQHEKTIKSPSKVLFFNKVDCVPVSLWLAALNRL